ncbi:hypothetical protein DFH07DRAFT_951535 [Mycena maculata]|uniref:Uncharacterized protein n=1 Tax=Mycena maculata TaxID=230809 RepID=A0AAD7NVK2_9AGAR|nr:hypothetical protein DFH07DRAFT_951535 [Mycena maculata]
MFCDTLAVAPDLPPGLQHLALCWDWVRGLHDPIVDEEPFTGEKPDFTKLRDVLVARCPSLTGLWQDGDVLFRWRQSQDGSQAYATLIDDEAKEERKNFAAFWKPSDGEGTSIEVDCPDGSKK